MINILALSLVATSLTAAGIWSPSPQRQDVRRKEGHTVVVVEYDKGGQRGTKVSISSPPPPPRHQPKPVEYFSKEALKEAASVLPNLGQGTSPVGKAGFGGHIPGELICDAFGKCTQTFASVFDLAKGKVSVTINEAKDKVKETAGKSKEALAHKGQALKERAKDTMGTAKDTAET
ncbi:uncharacterized protein LOC120180646 [Hibiscus syriacus]|uniref:uncharacterized protein LOC120180646 n=1 Tax=Hibiscus syriacus TaxID=106335 RepID=UPI001924E3DC|nr:uncharacterized protein LOC120180646 [Hibiscus syriacus]